MKLQEILDMMNIKELQQVQSINFFHKKTGSGVSVNERLAKELHKPVTEKFKRRKVYARFKDNILAADLAEMESLSSNNKNVKYLLYVIDVFTKYTWVKPLKDKNGKAVLNAFYGNSK